MYLAKGAMWQYWYVDEHAEPRLFQTFESAHNAFRRYGDDIEIKSQTEPIIWIDPQWRDKPLEYYRGMVGFRLSGSVTQ